MLEQKEETEEVKKLKILVAIFNRLFESSENTLLETGADEPFYKASITDKYAKIVSREDYLSSALHEVAHWIIAGKERRLKDDFGYWYEPEGRTKEQQALFEQVEIKPQAIEWILSLACKQLFSFSADNLSQNLEASESFKQAVNQQAQKYIKEGLPKKGERLLKDLIIEFRMDMPLSVKELDEQNA